MTAQRKPKRSRSFSSSGQTAQSKTTTELLALGGTLVEQFKLRADEDTLGQWMAHYLAEKLIAHKKAVGGAKAALEAELVDLVLKFWKHRAYFPRGSRPFEEYEPVLRALESLDPDQSDGRYFQRRFFEKNSDVGEGPSQAWIDAARALRSRPKTLPGEASGWRGRVGIDGPHSAVNESRLVREHVSLRKRSLVAP